MSPAGGNGWRVAGRTSVPKHGRHGDCPRCGARDVRLVRLDVWLGTPCYVCGPCRNRRKL